MKFAVVSFHCRGFKEMMQKSTSSSEGEGTFSEPKVWLTFFLGDVCLDARVGEFSFKVALKRSKNCAMVFDHDLKAS